MTKTCAAFAAMLAGGLLVAGAGGASAEETVTGRIVHDTFSHVTDFVDEDVCAPEEFDVDVHEEEYARVTALFDAEGNFVHALVHITYTTAKAAQLVR